MEAIDTADTTDDSDVFEIEPMNELRVGHDVQLTCMVKVSGNVVSVLLCFSKVNIYIWDKVRLDGRSLLWFLFCWTMFRKPAYVKLFHVIKPKKGSQSVIFWAVTMYRSI